MMLAKIIHTGFIGYFQLTETFLFFVKKRRLCRFSQFFKNIFGNLVITAKNSIKIAAFVDFTNNTEVNQ